jgi:hypothetical protein
MSSPQPATIQHQRARGAHVTYARIKAVRAGAGRLQLARDKRGAGRSQRGAAASFPPIRSLRPLRPLKGCPLYAPHRLAAKACTPDASSQHNTDVLFQTSCGITLPLTPHLQLESGFCKGAYKLVLALPTKVSPFPGCVLAVSAGDLPETSVGSQSPMGSEQGRHGGAERLGRCMLQRSLRPPRQCACPCRL